MKRLKPLVGRPDYSFSTVCKLDPELGETTLKRPSFMKIKIGKTHLKKIDVKEMKVPKVSVE